MRIVITGSPGVGKTTIAKKLAKKLKYGFINERDFALSHGIGKWDHEQHELVMPLKKLRDALSQELKTERNVIIEGHLLCEIKLNVDFVIVLRTDPELLEIRLSRKQYPAEKVMDNVFCEGIDYCKKHAMRKYGKRRMIEVKNEKTIKETMYNIIKELRERGAKI